MSGTYVVFLTACLRRISLSIWQSVSLPGQKRCTSARWWDRGMCLVDVKAKTCFAVPHSHHEKKSWHIFWAWLVEFLQKLLYSSCTPDRFVKGQCEICVGLHCQNAFENVKTLLCSAAVLSSLCMDKPFKIQVASQVGAAAILLQVKWNWQTCLLILQKVQFVSTLLFYKREGGTGSDLGASAVRNAGSGPAVVFTNHNPLTFLSSLRCPNQRLMLWSLFRHQTY